MKNICMLLLAALFVCATVMGQEQEKKKKKGGLLNALKKGVESATGIDVSKETLFVYPEVGVWKMSVVSCTGDPATGTVKLVVGAIKLMGNPVKNSHVILFEAKATGSTTLLQKERRSADPFYNFELAKLSEIDVEDIYEVPTGAKTIDVKFYIDYRGNMFEARDVPITWQAGG